MLRSDLVRAKGEFWGSSFVKSERKERKIGFILEEDEVRGDPEVGADDRGEEIGDTVAAELAPRLLPRQFALNDGCEEVAHFAVDEGAEDERFGDIYAEDGEGKSESEPLEGVAEPCRFVGGEEGEGEATQHGLETESERRRLQLADRRRSAVAAEELGEGGIDSIAVGVEGGGDRTEVRHKFFGVLDIEPLQ